MKSWALKNRLLFLSMLPLTLSIVVIGAYFLKANIDTLRQHAHDQGRLIARQLAPAMEYGIVSGNKKSLEKLARNALSNSSVIRVSVYNDEESTLLEKTKNIPERPAYRLFFDYAFELFSGLNTTDTFSYPVTSEVIPLNDFFEASSNKEPQKQVGYVEVEISFSDSAYEQVLVAASAFGIATAVILLVYASTSLISRQINRSISELADTVESIQAGNFSARARIDDEQELGSLASGINVMASQIARSKDDLEREVAIATSELKQKNEALTIAQAEAVSANKAKSVFLANMSHEIRTPLNGIIGFLDMLNRTKVDSQQNQYISTAQVAAKSLIQLINGILDFSRIESGKMPLKQDEIPIDDLLAEIYDLHAPSAFEKGVELLFFPAQSLPSTLMLDANVFKQIIGNLLSNAIKFTQHGDIQLHMNYFAENRAIAISVLDSGVGISQEVINDIFNEFEQGDNTTARVHGGSGLGLAITRSLVELHGGSISAHTRPEGGARFDLTIQASQRKPAPPPRHDLKVLLTSLNDNSTQSFKLVLQRYGYHVLTQPPSNDTSDQIKRHITLVSGDELHYRFHGASDSVALVSSNDPAKLNVCLDWGMRQAFCKTLSRDTLTAIILGKAEQKHRAPSDALSDTQLVASGLHILVVDDNHINLTLMDSLLSELGAEVLMSDNGETAIEAAKTNHIDLVFLDIHMPVIDGFETCRQLRALPKGQDLHIVALSADGVESAKHKAFEAGMDEYLIKPVARSELIGLINKHTKDSQGVPKPIADDSHDGESSDGAGEDLLLTELRSMFTQSLPQWMNDVHQAHLEQDRDALFQAAHKIFGACVYCHYPKIEEAAKALEDTARDQLKEQYDERVAALDAAVAVLL